MAAPSSLVCEEHGAAAPGTRLSVELESARRQMGQAAPTAAVSKAHKAALAIQIRFRATALRVNLGQIYSSCQKLDPSQGEP